MNWLKRHSRLAIAAAIAPIAGILALALVTGRGVAGFEWFLFWGAPGAYIVEFVIGYPAYTLLAANKSFPFGRVVIIGAIGGAVAFVVPLALVSSLVNSSGMFAGMFFGGAYGALGGCAAGATFWLIAFSGRANVLNGRGDP